MKKSFVVLLAAVFLFSVTCSVMAAACGDANSPKTSCSKAKAACGKDKKGCDKKKSEDPNKACGKKA